MYTIIGHPRHNNSGKTGKPWRKIVSLCDCQSVLGFMIISVVHSYRGVQRAI